MKSSLPAPYVGCILLVTALTMVTPSAAVLDVFPKWNLALVNTTTDTCGIGGGSPPTRAHLAGDVYLFTDVNATLYAIETNSGTMLWNFSQWKSGSKKQPSLSGNSKRVVAEQGEYMYCFETDSGAVQWVEKADPKIANKGYSWVVGNELIAAADDYFEVRSTATGIEMWNFTGMWAPEYGALAVSDSSDGSGYVAVVRRISPEGDGVIMILDRETGVRQSMFPLSAAQTLNRHPMIFWLTNDFMMFYTATEMVKVSLPSGNIVWRTPLDFYPVLYGLGKPYIYLHTEVALYSYNFSTGVPLAVMNLTGQVGYDGYMFDRIDHLWGFNNFACLGMLQNIPSSSKQQLNVSAFSGPDMNMFYSVAPADVSESKEVYGNSVSIGLVVIPGKDGLTIVTKDGQTWDNQSKNIQYPCLVSQSVALGDSSVYFTYNNQVQALEVVSRP